MGMSKNLKQLLNDFQPKENRFWRSGIRNLDFILGGGFPVGKIVEIHSEAGCGKTTMSLQIARHQLQNGRSVVFLDVENSLTDSLKRQVGVSEYETVERECGWPQFLHLTPTTFNQVEQIMEEILSDEAAYDLIIFDSITMTNPDRQNDGRGRAKKISDEEPGLAARVQARFLLRFKGELYRSDTTMLLLNQMRTNLKGFSGNAKPAGGKALEFACDVRIGIKRDKTVKRKLVSEDQQAEREQTVGFELTASATKNKYAMPYVPISLWFEFGKGVNNTASVALHLIALNIIKASGSWYTVPGQEKSLRADGVSEWVRSHTELVEELLWPELTRILGGHAPPALDAQEGLG